MNDKKIPIFTVTIIGLILVPHVINMGISIIDTTTSFAAHLGNKRAYNKRIKNGLKDGGIEIINGQYYEKVESEDEA